MSNLMSLVPAARINCGTGVSLDISGPITVCLRCKLPIGDPSGTMLTTFMLVKDGGTYRYGIYRDSTSKTMSFYVRLTINGVKSTDVSRITNDGLWHHYTGTFDGRYVRFYIDGDLKKTTDAGSADTITTGPGTAMDIGYWGAGGAYITELLSECQIYNRQLSDSEVYYNYGHPNNPKRQGIQLNLIQDSIYGAQWSDLSGNGNHGVYTGNAVPQVANRLAGR